MYTNAGHNPPILFRRREELIRLDHGGPILGVFPEWSYEQFEFTLEPGDRILLFTDGVTEASNSEGDDFGEARLIAAARSAGDAAAPELVAGSIFARPKSSTLRPPSGLMTTFDGFRSLCTMPRLPCNPSQI